MPEAPAAIARLVDDQDVLAAAAPARLELEGEMIGGAQAVDAGADDRVFGACGTAMEMTPSLTPFPFKLHAP